MKYFIWKSLICKLKMFFMLWMQYFENIWGDANTEVSNPDATCTCSHDIMLILLMPI